MLLLFDIDGTLLLRASREHAEALREALVRVYGAHVAQRVPAAGRTDTAIARDLAALAGIGPDEFDARLPAFIAACGELYSQLCPPSLADHLAPGMPELLEALRERGDIDFSLVTGNYEVVARLKLERAGIGDFFPPGQGGFGSDGESRDLLPTIARARAGDHPRESTILIGDTPLDVACARADGVRVLAVATGMYEAGELSGADEVAADGWELAGILWRALDVGGAPAPGV
ncbi:MAG TPA: haloacid dehalogenase-like hydrolase [Solirubrobacteraceae bacterium]|jgi:phosphoglycolate phosphatase-like HAD superfamily hydrolase